MSDARCSECGAELIGDDAIRITFKPHAADAFLRYLRAVQRPGIFAENIRLGWDEANLADNVASALAYRRAHAKSK